MTSITAPRPIPRPVIEPDDVAAFFRRQLTTVTVTETQALTLADVVEAIPAYADDRWRLDPGPRLAEEVRALAREDPHHHAERWGENWDALADICEKWHPALAFAVLWALDKYWVSDSNDILREVGLLR
ncbi:hypothetical protein [Nocardia blacklockiae]|uniref:hypothetical protein n=1 Tax=Nocardia blacklockiae TaxID=480036 RepID=UPI0018933A1B|nr:hypothetical protein [Nocardia blacklockiae]MBF6171071.1 hypothetical protein [Nocardia blacklockiae]